MAFNIEDLAKTHTVLVDTCYFHSMGNDICSSLYNPKDLHKIDPQDIKEEIEEITKGREFTERHSPIFLDEVVREMIEYRDQLNNHLSYFEHQRTTSNGKSKNKRSFKHREKTREALENFEQQGLLYLLADKLASLVTKISHQKYGPSFSEEQHELYRKFNSIADLVEQKIQKTQTYESSNFIHPTNLGEELGTDKKIISAAYTIAMENPVLILTKDSDIRKYHSQMQFAIKYLDPHISTPPLPEYDIVIPKPSIKQEENLRAAI